MKKLLGILLAAMMLLSSAAALAEEWTCPSCGNTASGNFCSNCGTAKPSEEWICPNCSINVKGNFCSNCGSARPSGSPAPVAAAAPARINKDPDAFKQMLNYLLSPFTNSSVTSCSPADESFTFTMSNGKSYMGSMSFDDGAYGITIINVYSNDYGSINNPYDVQSEEFINVLNFLLEINGRSVKAIMPVFGRNYTVRDSAGDTYTLTFLCSPMLTSVELTKD